jgi:hypothetical protein
VDQTEHHQHPGKLAEIPGNIGLYRQSIEVYNAQQKLAKEDAKIGRHMCEQECEQLMHE